ncbi:succinyl-CoA synthetase subunit beta [Candidatus Atribacteria bacterium HGW-Atribacteria-1]|nr:MAG: succinyl-CoA synthetase subunit beta [Candidatus Atribacteria bacterium HGW-Atribacteria-1]
MRLHEYEAEEIFSKYGINVPQGGLAKTTQEAVQIATNIGVPVVLKSQVLVGGRGKAGGVKIIDNLNDVERVVAEILKSEIKGFKPEGVLVLKKIEIKKEIYLGITIERTSGIPIIMLCSEGGVDIEEVAHRNPEKIFKLSVDTLQNLYSFQIINMVKKIGLTGKTLIGVVNTVFKLYQVFKKYDGLIAEINPLVITENHEIFCVDAVLEVDDSALFRHPELNKRKLNNMSERDKRLMEKGATFVKLDGNIGIICSGAGLAMTTMDLIKDYPSLAPANFLETGGGITSELMFDCMELVLEQPGLKAVLINLYGGINPIHEGAKGIAKIIREKKVNIPIVAKALGNRQEETWKTLEEAGVYVIKESETQKAVKFLSELLGVKK